MTSSAGSSNLSNLRGAAPLRALAGALMLRAGVHGVFAVWLITRHPAWADIFHVGAIYAIVDGGLGLVAAALLEPLMRNRSPRLLATMTLVDAAGRVALGIALLALPAIAVVPVAVTSLFGAVGLSAAALGVLAMTVWIIARVHAGHAWSVRADELFDPLAAAALISFVIGLTLFVNPPATAGALRLLGTSASAGLALVFVVASLAAASRKQSEIIGF